MPIIIPIKLVLNRRDLTNFHFKFSQCNDVDLRRNLKMMPVGAGKLDRNFILIVGAVPCTLA